MPNYGADGEAEIAPRETLSWQAVSIGHKRRKKLWRHESMLPNGNSGSPKTPEN